MTLVVNQYTYAKCDSCSRSIRVTIGLDPYVGMAGFCECAVSDDRWTTEEMEAMRRGECPYYEPKEASQ